MKKGYEQAALDLESQTSAVVAEINCDRQENKTIMQKYGVRGFPTLLWFDADGSRKIIGDHPKSNIFWIHVDMVNFLRHKRFCMNR